MNYGVIVYHPKMVNDQYPRYTLINKYKCYSPFPENNKCIPVPSHIYIIEELPIKITGVLVGAIRNII